MRNGTIFLGRIVSLLSSNIIFLARLKKVYPKIHTVLEKGKERLLKVENQMALKNERLKES